MGFLLRGCDALNVDAVDADLDHVLAMAVGPLRVVLAALLLEDHDLLTAGLAENRRHHRGALDDRVADLRLVAADHQHFVERDFVLIGIAEHVTLDLQTIACGYSILLSTGPA